MKALELFLFVGPALVALLVGVAQLDGYVAGSISLVAATLVSNWYQRNRRRAGD